MGQQTEVQGRSNVCIVTQRNIKAVTARKSMLSVKEGNFSRRTGYVITALIKTMELQNVEAEIVVDVVRSIIHSCPLKTRKISTLDGFD